MCVYVCAHAYTIFAAIESSDYKVRNFIMVVSSRGFGVKSTFARSERLFVEDYTKDKNKRSDYGYALRKKKRRKKQVW